MPKKKLFIILLLVDIGLFLVYELSKQILNVNGLAYRDIVNYSAFAALTLLTLAIAAFVIVFLFKQVGKKETKPAIRVLAGIGATVIIIIGCVSSLNDFILGVFDHQEEHVTEKDGQVMLARVDSFLQVEVRYYDHVNTFVRGKRVLIHEDYGNGGYDPFDREVMPEVQRYIYYDENGEIIKSNWFDGY